MEKAISKQGNSANLPYKPNLTNALVSNNRDEIKAALAPYKGQNGLINYPALLSIPSADRLPAMAANDPKKASAVVLVALETAMASMNLVRPMNAHQMLDLVEAILESSTEDNLSLEDLMLFLQKLIRGEYGPLYESMDIPKFMDHFEKYREERHRAWKNHQDERAASHTPDYSEPRLSELGAREENLKNIAAVLEYSKIKKVDEAQE